MSLRSPYSQARGLGSAKYGVSHWWLQRLTAVALVPLSLWFVGAVVYLSHASSAAVVGWMSSPAVAIALVIFLFSIFYHSQLGLQIIIEDYVHGEFVRLACVTLMKFLHVVAAVAAIFAVLHLAFGGS